ncbi:unnamed protein product [Rotaria magnacalcarata]
MDIIERRLSIEMIRNDTISFFLSIKLNMGLNISGTIDRARHPERYPDKSKGPTFDPMYGFADGRKPKE